ncbi:hypothetical protein [Verrucomicrobium sp. BvORR106]|uniref:hypothetical protein n=1 Tax=Verrucomicrobium sp. BvORR106 TaxID=1403819 RepID=UPI000570C47A|nr:hypothetical protein [Verrucomicrobium sp. BvORR106]
MNSILIKDALENLCHRLLTGYPRTPLIPQAAVQAFRQAKWNAEATPSIELVSGTPTWTDEAYEAFVIAHFHFRSERYQDPFIYRLFLIDGIKIEGVDYDRCRESWDYLRVRCPRWPGFREDRCTPAIKEQILILMRDTYAAL